MPPVVPETADGANAYDNQQFDGDEESFDADVVVGRTRARVNTQRAAF